MPNAIKQMLYILAATVTVLAVYLALRYVLPEALSLLRYLLIIMFPFLLAAIFSIFMEPLVVFFNRDGKVPRLLAVTLAMVVFFGSIGLVLTFLILRLVKELYDLSIELPQKIESAQHYIDTWFQKGVLFYGTLPKGLTDNIQNTVEEITASVQNWIYGVISILIHLISGVPGIIMLIIISLIATYFFSSDRQKITELWIRIVPSPWGERTMEIIRQVAWAFQAYVRAQFILISITTVISIIGLFLLGVNYAITIGLVVGILDMIPVLGPGTVFIPWAIWAFVTGEFVLGLKLSILYVLLMVIRAVMEAKVVAVNLGLHPLAVLMAMYIGLKTIGVLGLILGPILVIAIQATVKALQKISK